MAATYRTSAKGGGTSGTGNRTVTITPASGDLLIVFCGVTVNTNATPTCTDDNGSGTYTLIGTALFNASQHMMSLFIRDALMANTTSTIITPNTGSNSSGEVVVVAYSGMTNVGSAGKQQYASQANQTAGVAAPTFSVACNTNNPVLTAIATIANPESATAPSSFTNRQNGVQTAATVSLVVDTRDSGFTGTAVTWGATDGDFASMALELAFAAAATASLFRPANLSLGAGGPFFSDPTAA